MKRKKWNRLTQPTSKFKSKLEEDFNNFLEQNEINFGYEDFKISYLKPEKPSKYTPDFNCPGNNLKIFFETKGQFLTSDRRKHLLVKQQHPDLDIRFVFSNSKNKIGKKSKTTYAKWCELKGFAYHCIYSTKKFLPDEWLEEIKNLQKEK
jgi:hypothetical protein